MKIYFSNLFTGEKRRAIKPSENRKSLRDSLFFMLHHASENWITFVIHRFYFFKRFSFSIHQKESLRRQNRNRLFFFNIHPQCMRRTTTNRSNSNPGICFEALINRRHIDPKKIISDFNAGKPCHLICGQPFRLPFDHNFANGKIRGEKNNAVETIKEDQSKKNDHAYHHKSLKTSHQFFHFAPFTNLLSFQKNTHCFTFKDAVFKICSQSSSKEIPADAAAFGTSDVSVMPGMVLISRKTIRSLSPII